MRWSLLGTLALGALVLISSTAMAEEVRVIVGFKGPAAKSLVQEVGGRVIRAEDDTLSAYVPARAIGRLRAAPAVAYLEEDTIAEIAEVSDDGVRAAAQTVPWGITKVNAPYTSSTAGAGVKVVVIDTGLDRDHPDLPTVRRSKTWVVNSTPEDDHSHGTHCAGTICALHNSIGVVGVAPAVKLWSAKVLDSQGTGYNSDVALGIRWAGKRRANIANMSFSSSANSRTIRLACKSAYKKGVLLIAASGNDGDGSLATDEIVYPAALSKVVAVGATTSSDGLAGFSNTGDHLEVSGPGVSVYSTVLSGGYGYKSGTSMACPHAVGVAALLWGAASSPSRRTIRTALQSEVRDLGTTGRDKGFGYGIVYWSP